MEAAREGVMFIATAAGHQLLRAAQAALDKAQVAVHLVTVVSTVEGHALEGGSPASVIVVGPGIANPAAVARVVARSHPLAHAVFVTEPGGVECLRASLLYSAPSNMPWQVVGTGDDVAAVVLHALEAWTHHAQFRSTLDRMNLRIAAVPAVDGQDYRRLLVSDHFLASVLRHAEDAIISLDLRGAVLSWNDGAVRLFGRQAPEVHGRPLDGVARWSEDPLRLVDLAARQGYSHRELDVVVGDATLTLDATFTAVRDASQAVIAVAAILRDVTARKRTEDALRANEARFRALADNIPQLAWMTDADGWIHWYNKRWFDYTGTTLEQMQGWGWRDVHHPDHLERVVAKFTEHLATQLAWEDSFPLRGADGGYRWFLSRAFPIRDEAGKVVSWFGTNTDITEERRAQEALRQADRRKDEFLGMLSHELRNPLAPIRNSIYLLEHAEGNSAVAQRARTVLRNQTEHLTRLVDDLLDVTRIARGKVELRRKRADLAEVARGAVEDYRAVIAAQGLELDATLPAAPVWADIDAARIGQVLGNLLQNAGKFTPAGGRVEVSLEASGATADISVRDTGVGIEDDLIGDVFEPFVQGERSLARTQGGLGLGLALAQGIARLHGGTLRVASEGKGKGCVFTLTLPRGVSPPVEPAGGARPEGEARGRRVLVVDDNRDAADSLAQLVTLMGHSVEVAYDGPEALKRAMARQPDVVLCDIGLPGMDGYEVARALRASRAPMRLFAVSGYARSEDVQQAVEAGFDGHLAKPPDPADIQRLLSASG